MWAYSKQKTENGPSTKSFICGGIICALLAMNYRNAPGTAMAPIDSILGWYPSRYYHHNICDHHFYDQLYKYWSLNLYAKSVCPGESARKLRAFNTPPPPPNAADMCQWTVSALVQIKACRLFSAKPLSKTMLVYCKSNPWELNFNQNTKLFIHKNASEKIVCEMAAISSRGRWVNSFLS